MGDQRDKIETGGINNSGNLLDRFQKVYETFLLCATLCLSVYHMVICMVRYIVKHRVFLEIIDRWFGLSLIIVFFVYLIITVRVYPQTTYRIKAVKQKMCTYEHKFMFFLFFWYVLSCFLRQFYIGTSAFKDNDWWIYITGLTSFVMFPLASFAGANRAKNLIDPMLKIVLIPHMVFFAWVIWQYFHMNYVTFPSGTVLEMNKESGIGLAVGENRNITGMCSLTLMCLCWYMVFSQKGFRKIPYGFGIIIYLTTLILSNCRTAWYSSLIMFAMVAFLFPWYQLETKGKSVRALVGVICVVVSIAFIQWFRLETFQKLDQAIHFTDSVPMSIQSSERTVNLAAHFYLEKAGTRPSATPLAEASDYIRTFRVGLNGREPVYRASFAVMSDRLYNFLFGVTHADVGKSLYGRFGVNKVFPSAHNYFLQMGVAFGVPVMIASVVFVGSLLLRCFRVLFFYKERLFSGAWMVPVVVITQLAGELTETWITAGSSIICSSFYLFAGWVVAMDIELRKRAECRECVLSE